MKKFKVLLVILLHLIAFIAIELLAFQWGQNNNRDFSIFLIPYFFYFCIGIPGYLILMIFYLFYNKIKKIIRKIIWFVFIPVFVLSAFIGLGYIIYLLPAIPTDGDEGFALIFASFFNSIFLIGFTSLVFLLSKKFLNDIFKRFNKNL